MAIAKVLIVENDEFNAQHLRRELLKMDFDVCAMFTSGESAVAEIAQLQPDLILMDISLDGDMDGIDAATKIAAIRPTPLIFLSGYTDELTLTRARTAKPYGYLVKPYSPQTLNATLQMLLERLQTERALRQSEARLLEAALVFEATQDGILILDELHAVTNTNQRFCDITGFSADEIQGMSPAFLNYDVLSPALFEQIGEAAGKARWSSQIQVAKKDGTQFPGNVTIASVQHRLQSSPADQGRGYYVVLIADLTAVRQAEDKLYRMAHHDQLTGLPNRQLAMDRLHYAIEQAKRRRSRMAVFFVDLDNFKQVNDSLGHNVGDELLRSVATRMQSCVRSVDTVARLGGDEFLVILDNIDDIKTVSGIASKMLKALSSPMLLPQATTEIFSSASIGISLYPEAGTTSNHLIRAADTAMYHAKARGRNAFSFYTPHMKRSEVQRAESSKQFHLALEQQQLEMHYQPQVEMTNREIIGLEALLRWRHPTRGLLKPEHILNLAEACGSMAELNAWILRSVCAQLQEWQHQQINMVKVAINVDHSQIFDTDFITVLEQCLIEFEVAPGLLEFEINEATLRNEKTDDAVFEKLAKLGISLAIDDFGSGYSSVNTLKRAPVKRIKIDQQFVHQIAGDNEGRLITTAILAMIKELNLIAVAEGIETAEQELFMRTHGCLEAQGYFYSNVVPPLEAQNMLGTLPAFAQGL